MIDRPSAGPALAYSAHEDHPLVSALLADQLGASASGLSLNIDARDDMFRFTSDQTHGYRELALVNYFRSGLSALRVVGRVLDRYFPAGKGLRILDFACGYGRATRFFVHAFPENRFTASDILADAVRFQASELGVEAFPSAVKPEDLICRDRFHAVLVLSLFSHLPPATFESWLGRLLALLEPGGMLLFSVHDSSLAPASVEPAEPGIRFDSKSETIALDPNEYGSTWVTEEYVASLLRRLGDGRYSYHRLRRGLWHFQDLYLVADRPDSSFEALDLPTEPEGHLDACTVEHARLLHLSGWALARAPLGKPVTVRVYRNGELMGQCIPTLPRPDVASFTGSTEVSSGWAFSCEAQGDLFRSTDTLLVKAVDARGTEFVLYLGSLEGVQLYLNLVHAKARGDQLAELLESEQRALRQASAERDAEQSAGRRLRGELEALQLHVATMEASRFWKLRNAWWRLRRALGLAR